MAGLVATNSIRSGKNREILDGIAADTILFETWSDEPWIIDGAAVRVSLICFARADLDPLERRLNGKSVGQIHPDLTAGGIDFTKARRLEENELFCVHGSKKIGSFDVSGNVARAWLAEPRNPNGRPNSDVLSPVWNGRDVTKRPADRWIVDFGMAMPESEAAKYEKPFEYVLHVVKPERLKNRNPELVRLWWLHGGPRPTLRNALPSLSRCIATPALAKHLFFVWVPRHVLPDAQLMVTLRDDEVTFGVLSSRFHALWCSAVDKSSLEDRPRYTPSVKFDTFPFPDGLTPSTPPDGYADEPRAKRIAETVRKLNELREGWLNPPDLVRHEPEVVPGFPDRILPVDDKAAAILRKRTLTKLYNERPAWLDNAHRELDAAVAAAYGWPADISDDEALARLFKLNQAHAAQ